MPRFAILEHDTPPGSARARHWDVMLEQGAVLRTWAAPQPPQIGMSLDIEQLADHRLAYLDYEGPVSGGRGTVTRFDTGQYELLRESPLELLFTLAGEKLRGRATLRRDDAQSQRWNLSITAE
jgi:hypothetical protein